MPTGRQFVRQAIANLTLQFKGNITARERKHDKFVGTFMRVVCTQQKIQKKRGLYLQGFIVVSPKRRLEVRSPGLKWWLDRALCLSVYVDSILEATFGS